MPCSLCTDLNREHTRECEREARAILQQQFSFDLRSMGIDLDRRSAKWDGVILASRKRQLEIAAKIQKHKGYAHAATA
jgi:hypothetical protein